jgi:hypothetical protein
LQEAILVASNFKKAMNPYRLASFIHRTYQQARFRNERKKLVCNLTRSPGTDIDALLNEVSLESSFMRALEEKFTLRKFNQADFELSKKAGTMFFNCVTLYLLVRLLRPEEVVETGGTPGKSSAFILNAMSENNFGHLYTVDLPPPEKEKNLSEYGNDFAWHSELPKGMKTGWIVPDFLKKRQTIIPGNSKHTLKPLLNRLGGIDFFVHDSDHSYENMKFEFETAFPFIREPGLLISDDIDHNRAFREFVSAKDCYSKKMAYIGIAVK